MDNLRQFQVQDYRTPEARGLSWDTMYTALLFHKDSLKNLTLRDLRHERYGLSYQSEYGNPKCLACFTKLETLWTDIDLLTDVAAEETNLASRIPESLQELDLDIHPSRDYSHLYEPIIASLVQDAFTQQRRQLRVRVERNQEVCLVHRALSGPIAALS